MLWKNSVSSYLIEVLALCLMVSLVSLNTGCTPNLFSASKLDRLSDEDNSEDIDLTQNDHSHTESEQALHGHLDVDRKGFTVVEAFVASRDIKREEPFTDENVGYRCFIPNDLPPHSIIDVTEVITQAARIDILQGQIITQDMLTPTNSITSPLTFADTPTSTLDNQIPMLADIIYPIEWGFFINVILAKRDLEQGTALTADALRTNCWPISVLPADFIVDQTEIMSYVTKIDIVQAQPLSRRFLRSPGQSITLDEDENMLSKHVPDLADLIYDNQGVQMMEVVVAERNIRQGQPIVAEAISVQPRSLELIPVGFVIEETDVIGYIAKIDLSKGEVIGHNWLTLPSQ